MSAEARAGKGEILGRFPHESPVRAVSSVRLLRALKNKIVIYARECDKYICRETYKAKLVLMTLRVHLFPSRTQKLSSVVPKILGW